MLLLQATRESQRAWENVVLPIVTAKDAEEVALEKNVPQVAPAFNVLETAAEFGALKIALAKSAGNIAWVLCAQPDARVQIVQRLATEMRARLCAWGIAAATSVKKVSFYLPVPKRAIAICARLIPKTTTTVTP